MHANKFVYFFIFQTISIDITAIIQLTVLLFGYIRSCKQEEETNNRLIEERTEILFLEDESRTVSLMSSFMDSFDPPLLRLNYANLGNSASRALSISEIENKLKEENPNLASAGFKLHPRNNSIV